jgi:hypothetical protein
MRNWSGISLRELKSDANLLREFYDDYRAIFGEVCKSCESKLNLYFKKLNNHKPNKMSASRTCKLKPNLNIYIRADHRFYNAATITDEAAAKFIAQHSKNKDKFLVLPKSAEKAAAKAEKAPEKAAEKKETKEGAKPSKSESKEKKA